jgi:hypothetical protein
VGSKGSGGITGYIYRFALHMGLCRGPIDELVEIRVDDKVAWQGSITTDSDSVLILQPDLFGGPEKEGGILGGLSVLMGKPDQDPATRSVPTAWGLSYGNWGLGQPQISGSRNIADLIGGMLPGFRGVTTLFYRGQIAANNPYPKPWKVRLRRTSAGWHGDQPWYPQMAAIWLGGSGADAIKAMNPAHIIYQCITDPAWGRGFPAEMLDDAAFTSVANRLCAESFGLCIRWTRDEPIADFLQRVLDHIGGVLYVDRETGLITLRLIRDDYDVEQLPIFDEASGLLEIKAEDSGAQDVTYNEVVVQYRSPVDDTDRQVRVHNLAGYQATGSVLSMRTDYPGVPTADLALRLAQRDLRVQAGGLKRFTVKLDRRGWRLAPGGVFRVRDLSRGIQDVVLRVGKVTESEHTNGEIEIAAVQDVFGLPDVAFIAYQPSTWTPPDRSAVVPTNRHIEEATYRDAVVELGAPAAAALGADAAAIVTMATRPTGLALDYRIASRPAGGQYADRGVHGWTPAGALDAAITAWDTVAALVNVSLPTAISAPLAALIGGEVVRVDAYDPETGVVTLARGCVDTLPAAHAAGTLVWFTGAGRGADGQDYLSGETVEVKLLTRTNSAVLPLDAAPTDSIVLDQRLARPYPPGNLRVNGATLEELESIEEQPPDLVFQWSHRDRILQQDQLVENAAGSIGPESGVTYTLRLYDGADLIHTESGIAGDTWTYDAATAAAEGSVLGLLVELEAVRGGLASREKYRFPVNRTVGFDLNFDRHFDGGS